MRRLTVLAARATGGCRPAHERSASSITARVNPALNTNFFTPTAAQYWWTATCSPRMPPASGRPMPAAASARIRRPRRSAPAAPSAIHVRCVRGAAPPASRPMHHFVNNGDGTVTDQDTGLTWQQAEAVSAMSWEAALQYAEGLSLAGQHRLAAAEHQGTPVHQRRNPGQSVAGHELLPRRQRRPLLVVHHARSTTRTAPGTWTSNWAS